MAARPAPTLWPCEGMTRCLCRYRDSAELRDPRGALLPAPFTICFHRPSFFVDCPKAGLGGFTHHRPRIFSPKARERERGRAAAPFGPRDCIGAAGRRIVWQDEAGRGGHDATPDAGCSTVPEGNLGLSATRPLPFRLAMHASAGLVVVVAFSRVSLFRESDS